MIKNYLLCTLFTVACLAQVGLAQERFLGEVFSEVEVTPNVTYGVNATVLFAPTVGEAIPEELKMDIYQPVGDDFEERPVILVFHTGNFLPAVTNGQITGTRVDSSVVEVCTRLARMGYVTAAVDYRLGWNPLAGSQPERALSLIQAAYRGIQDGRTAIRFFRDNYSNGGNTYAINPSKIGAVGLGTGSYIVLGMASLDNYNEIINTTNGAGKFLLDLDMNGVGETPMVVPDYHGDIEGKTLAVAPDNAFGLPAGDTLCYPNYPDESSWLNLAMNVGGAMGDISWLDERSTSIISVHSAYDIFAPYDDAVLIVPTTNENVVRVQGSKYVAEEQNSLGNNQAFIDAMINDVYTSQAMANSATAGHPFYEALYPVVNQPNSNNLDEGVVVDWWDPAAPAPGQGQGVPWNSLPHPSGGTFHTQGLVTNEGMSAEKARTNIDTIIGFFAPRAFVVLELDNYTSNENLQASEVSLMVGPNPASAEIRISTRVDAPMEYIQLTDISGRVVRQFANVNDHQFTLTRGDLPAGHYILSIGFEQGRVSKKVVLK